MRAKILLNASFGILTELLYAAAIILAGLCLCLAFRLPIFK